MKARAAISIGDVNGVGIEIALRMHDFIAEYVEPLYCVHHDLLLQGYEILQKKSKNLKLTLPEASACMPPEMSIPLIQIATISAESGGYSFGSFQMACELCESKEADFMTTLPIHKHAWHLAHVPFIGHTQALSKRYEKQAIMVLGCERMLVGLFSDHIALKEISQRVDEQSYLDFLLRFYEGIRALAKEEKIAVLGLNPHCGDGGLMGNEDACIQEAIEQANAKLKKAVFIGCFAPDSAFSPPMRKRFKIFAAPYHDVGLSALKALYFEESINITLNIPILRTSVDHGTAYDLAYKGLCSTKSYENAILLGKKLSADG